MKKIILSLFLASNLSFTGTIQSWSNGLINSSTESAGYFKTQTRGYYTLGSQTIHLGGQGAFSLAHIEFPSLSVGCGGIDAVWGGFSFLSDPKYLVAKLKAIGYAAAAYAFKQAISSLCKDCNEIMGSLENVSDAINNFNLDTCAIGKNMEDQAIDFFTDARQNNLSGGIGNDAIKEKDKPTSNVYADYINNVAASISAAGGTAADAKKMVDDKAALGSFVAEAISKSDKTGVYAQKLFGTDGETGEGKLLGVIRYLIGDAIGYQAVVDGEMVTKYEQIVPSGDIDKVLKQFIYGNNIPYKTLKMDNNHRYLIRGKAKTFSFIGGLYGLYKNRITNIVQKMQTYTPITASDRSFIQMQPIPMYKMLNVVAIQGNQALLEQSAEQLALREAIIILNHLLWVGGTDISAELQETTPDSLPKSIENRRVVLKNIQKVKVLMQKIMANKMKSYSQNVMFMDKIRDYERQIKSQSQSQLLNMLGSFK